jgi:hypothetical protein
MIFRSRCTGSNVSICVLQPLTSLAFILSNVPFGSNLTLTNVLPGRMPLAVRGSIRSGLWSFNTRNLINCLSTSITACLVGIP